VRSFLRTAYTDERLTWLLAHARNGQLSYRSCCCLVGVATADHPLRGKVPAGELDHPHYALAKTFLGAPEAELAYYYMGHIGRHGLLSSPDRLRRRRLIPMVRSELRRREWLRAMLETEQALVAARRRPELDVYA
jgi:hypothetical protein